MAKDKYGFIKDLLKNKKISPNQRERILVLAANDIKGASSLEERILKIEAIVFQKEQVFVNDFTNNEKEQQKTQVKLPKYFNPFYLYRFLFEYNQNKVLKSTCHDIDSDEILTINEYCDTNVYSFQKHVEKIKEAFDQHEKSYFAPAYIKALIRGYLTGKDYYGFDLKDGWSKDHIKINWSHPDLVSWAELNPYFPPNPSDGLIQKHENIGFEIDRITSNISGGIIQNFTELVLHFKHIFHIRNDNSLNQILKNKNEREEWNDVFDFEINSSEFPKNIEFFTDIDKLLQAYTRIIRLIFDSHESKVSKPKVKLKLFEKDSCVYLSIHHLNNTYKKSLRSTIERGVGRSYGNLIDKQVNGLCNLYLRADFGGDNFAIINLWNGEELRNLKSLDSFEGVEHILEFPKNERL